jgi:hypothetical protein
MTRCANERALGSDTGLTPSAYASGASIRRGHISRQGASRLRHVRVETAWRALPRATARQEICDRIAAPRGKQRAMVAIARRRIGRIRAGLRPGTLDAVGPTGSASVPPWSSASSAEKPGACAAAAQAGAPGCLQGKASQGAEALSRDRDLLIQV